MRLRTLENNHWPITILSTLSALLNMLLPMVMARSLSAHDVGQFRIFFLYLSILPSIGLTSGVVNGIYYWAGKEKGGTHLIQTAWSIHLAHAFTVVALVGVVLTASTLFHLPFLQTISTSTSILFLIATLPTILVNFFDFTAIAMGRIWLGAFFSSGFEILRTLVVLLILIKTHNLMWVLFAHTFIMCLRVTLGNLIGLRLGVFKFHFRPKKETIKELVTYAGPVSIAAAFDILTSTSDRLILSSFLSPSDFAVYAIGCLSIPPLLILEQSVNKILIPKLSQALHNQDKPSAVQLYNGSIKELAKILIPAVTGLIVFAEPIISLLFSNRYQSASHYLRLFAFSYLLLGIPYDSLARASGDGKWILKNCVVFGVLSLGIVGAFSWIFGASGALIGALLCQFSLRIYSLNIVKLRLDTSWPTLVPIPSLLLFTGISLTLALLSLAIHPFFPSGQTWFFCAGSAFGVLYFAGLSGCQYLYTLSPRNRPFQIAKKYV